MIVGRNPGEEEEKKGRPFVGPAGRLLDKIVALAGFDRSMFFVDNIVACHTPDNEPPTDEQVNACWTWLQREIELVQPKGIIALGVLAIKRLTGQKLKVTKSVGAVLTYGDLFSCSSPVLCLPHPSYYLRAGLTDRTSKEIQEVVTALKTFLS